jgi:hypothetical protein
MNCRFTAPVGERVAGRQEQCGAAVARKAKNSASLPYSSDIEACEEEGWV